MKRNDSLDANNVAADSSCNDAAKCTNGSILKGHCWFTDGYDSFDLTEDLYENEDGSFDIKLDMLADGSYQWEYWWAIRHRETRLTKEQAEDWMSRYAGKKIIYDNCIQDTEKSFKPIDDGKKFSEEHPDAKFLRMCLAGLAIHFAIDDEPFFGDYFISRCSIWPRKEDIIEIIEQAAGLRPWDIEHPEFEFNQENLTVITEDSDDYRFDTFRGCYVYIAADDELLEKLHGILKYPARLMNINGTLMNHPFVTNDYMLKTIPEWKEYEKEHPPLWRKYWNEEQN